MNLKRTVYHIAGTDYDGYDIVEFTFMVQRVSINNFLNMGYSEYAPATIRRMQYAVGDYTIDPVHTWVDNAVKPVTIKCTAAGLYLILKALGMHDSSCVESNVLYVRKRELRAVQCVTNQRYNGISVFDPKTKTTRFVSNSPKKIEGRQAVINGKLWRKYWSK